jgi:hypothetical protein
VYDGREKAVDIDVAGTTSQHDLESNKDSMPPSRKAPWWSRYSGYQRLKAIPPSKTRRTILFACTAGAITIIVLFVWLAKTHRLGGFPLEVSFYSIEIPQSGFLAAWGCCLTIAQRYGPLLNGRLNAIQHSCLLRP